MGLAVAVDDLAVGTEDDRGVEEIAAKLPRVGH